MDIKANRIRKSNISLMFVCLAIILFFAIDNMFAQETEESVDESTMNIKLFYLGPDGNTYLPEYRQIAKYDNTTDQAKIALMELIRGPMTNLIPTTPKGTQIRALFIDRKQCAYVDFSREIIQNHMGGVTAELATIASIVNTLTANFPKDIHKVRILVNGKEVRTLAGHIDITKPIYPF